MIIDLILKTVFDGLCNDYKFDFEADIRLEFLEYGGVFKRNFPRGFRGVAMSSSVSELCATTSSSTWTLEFCWPLVIGLSSVCKEK